MNDFASTDKILAAYCEGDLMRNNIFKSALLLAFLQNCLLSSFVLAENVQTEPTSQTNDAVSGNVDKAPSVIWKPGESLSVGTDTEDLVPTDDIELAKRQVAAYPDSPEASFILAVALTRTSRVEEALQQVRHARKLAEAKGGPVYFDKMIASYEQMLKYCPDENRVRYGLAWAYYMKAYLLSRYSKKVAAWKAIHEQQLKQLQQQQLPQEALKNNEAANNEQVAALPKATNNNSKNLLAQVTNTLTAMASNKPVDPSNIPHIPSALEKADPADIPQIKKYYELALLKLDELLARNPKDVWATVYRAHLKAEYTGNVEEAMNTWKQCQVKYPNNPAPYFFLGEGYLKQGNLKESINNVSKAIALRALGN
jgi:tetratricopeptide (TPR) repeat protein